MLGRLTIFLLSLLSVLAGPNQKNCREKLDIPATQSCCKLPAMDFKVYEKKCGHLVFSGIHLWPCSFECIYKAAGVLNGTRLDFDNLNLMMNELLKDKQQLKVLFAEGFVKCQAKEEEMLKTLKRCRFPDKAKCSPLAMLYGICAYKHVFNHCPDENWTNSSMCNRIRACELAKLNLLE